MGNELIFLEEKQDQIKSDLICIAQFHISQICLKKLNNLSDTVTLSALRPMTFIRKNKSLNIQNKTTEVFEDFIDLIQFVNSVQN